MLAAGVSLVSAHLTPSLVRRLFFDRRDTPASACDGLRPLDGRSSRTALERYVQ